MEARSQSSYDRDVEACVRPWANGRSHGSYVLDYFEPYISLMTSKYSVMTVKKVSKDTTVS